MLNESYDLFSKIDVEQSLQAEVQPLISFDLSTKTMLKFDVLLGEIVNMFKANKVEGVNLVENTKLCGTNKSLRLKFQRYCPNVWTLGLSVASFLPANRAIYRQACRVYTRSAVS